VVGYDRQGYGRSEGRKGYAENYKEYVDEVAYLLIECERRYPDLPVFLYGHSMGGHLLLRYLIRRHPNINAAVVSAPHIRLAFTPNPLLVGLGKVMRMLHPTFSQDNQLDTNLLSRTPTIKPTYDADPFAHAKLTSRTGIDILENADELNRYADGLHVPTLLMHGEADGITSHDGSKDLPNGTRGPTSSPGQNSTTSSTMSPSGRRSLATYSLGWKSTCKPYTGGLSPSDP